MPRLSDLKPEDMTDHQKEVYETIVAGPRGRVQGPLAVWLRRPELADRAQALGRYCRFDSSLPPRLSELAILTTAQVWKSQFEWAAHKPIALQAGIAPEIVDAIELGEEPAFEHSDEAIVYRFARTLHGDRTVDDDLYDAAVRTLGEEAVIDLTGILGYYTLISMTINVFDVAPPAGSAPGQQ